MEIFILIAIIIAIVAAIFLIKIIKGIMKLMLYALIIFLLIAGVFTYFAIKDVQDISKGLDTKSNIFLLKDDESIVSGFTVHKLNLSTIQEIEDIEVYSDYYSKKEYKKILDDNYKLIVIEKSALPETRTPELLERISKWLPKDFSALSPDSFPVMIIYNLKNDPAYVIKGYRNNTIEIYPDSFLLKVGRIKR
jgi:hypothetical protein